MALTNKYPGTCADCGARVKAGAGFARKTGGSWRVYCADCEAPAPVARSLTLAGGAVRLTLPYDAAALPLLRSLPGARWDSASASWTARVSSQPEAARVFEIATTLGIATIPDALRALSEAVPACPRADTAGLYPYQRDGVRFLATHDRALLADEPGLGKTAQALLAVPDGAPVLVVAPACVLYSWVAECRRWRPDLTPRVARGRELALPAPGELVVCSWAALPAEPPATPADLVLIADEAHFAKNFRAARSKRLQALAAKCARVWLLTGTPLANRPTDLYSVLQVGGLRALGSWLTFVRLFGGVKNQWGGWEWGTPGPEVSERLKACMLRRRKAEVLADLPAKQYTELSVPADAAATRWLDELDQYTLDELASGHLPPFEELSRARAALALGRVGAVLELVEQYEDPVVVFSAHRAPVDALGAREGWAAIHGDVSPEQRAEIVRRFQAGELRGVAITIAAGGVGITLTRATTAIFVDLAWNPADNTQAEDRIHRIGQRNAVTIVRMVSDHPIDRRVQELLTAKIALVSAALDSEAVFDTQAVVDRDAIDKERAERARVRAETVAREEAESWLAERETSILARAAGVSADVAITAPIRAWVEQSLASMVSVCDGARTQDGVGFSRVDARTAHWIYRAGLRTDRTYRLALAILSRYPRQVGRIADALAAEEAAA